jgi:protein TonB
MADTHILPPDPNEGPAPHLTPAADAPHLGTELKEEGVFASLVSSFRDVFFPAKLPRSSSNPSPSRFRT